MNTRKGFTLIELLVVIAIIAILAAILLPVFISAKQAGRTASCCNNIKQLSRAFQLYADDNGNCIPLAFTQCTVPYPDNTTDPEGAGNWLWMHYMYRYVKSNKVYNCPASLGGKYKGGYYWEGGKNDLAVNNGAKYSNASYGCNRWLGRYYFEPRVTFSDIRHPSTTPLLADCSYYLTGPKYASDIYANDFPPQGRHNGMCMMSFVDGHVKAVNPKDWVTTQSKSASDPVWRKWDPLLQ